MKKIENILKKLNDKAKKNGDVPVSSLIVYNDKIISKSYNMREYKNNPLYHAEILAIIKASKKLNSWNLSECTIYSTMKPCSMCLEVIKMAKIKNINYFVDNNKMINYNIKMNKIDSDQNDYFIKELKDFFANKR